MKTLYYLHFGAHTEPGVDKKIKAQVEQIEKYINVKEINICEKVENPGLLRKISTNMILIYANKYLYDEVLNKIENNSLVYLRRNKADKYYVNFLKKLYEKNCVIIVELPTYPYFKDDYSKIKYWPAYFKELRAIPKFKRYVNRFVTYSNDKEIFGVSTLKVKNGIYVNQIEPRHPLEVSANINLLAVATFRKHHGYERVINGLAEYYKQGGERNITLRMVGDGDEKQKYQELVRKHKLEKHVDFLGRMVGDDLEKQYDWADIALGSFGMYKIDVYNSSVLKVREYLAKGLPIISGCHEDAFEDEKFGYFLEFPNDMSTISIKRVINFYDNIYQAGFNKNIMVKNIREYARRHINYDVVFQNVIDYIRED